MAESPEMSASMEIDIENDDVEFNAYGSPIQRPAERVRAEAPVVMCQCKNTCSRKQSARSTGCPCKTADAKCSNNCKCGTAKLACKNRGETEVVNRNPSAFARHQEEMATAEVEVKDFIAQLNSEDKDLLLLRLLTQGRGSLDFAQNLLQDAQEPPDQDPEPAVESPPWCRCHVCTPMPTEQENVCCKKTSRCVTSSAIFRNICLDIQVLQLAIRARCDIRAEQPDYSTNSYRKVAYRQYCLWKYGKLGRGNRRVLPACVVNMIRSQYSRPGEQFMGFRRS